MLLGGAILANLKNKYQIMEKLAEPREPMNHAYTDLDEVFRSLSKDLCKNKVRIPSDKISLDHCEDVSVLYFVHA